MATASDEPERRVWSEAENSLTVHDYFDMLRKELDRQDFSKAEHWRALLPSLDRRTKGSVELKHENISAILVGMGLPYIEGYKPHGNYQQSLADKVGEVLDARPGFLDQLQRSPLLTPAGLPDISLANPDTVRELPPDRTMALDRSGKPWLTLKGRRIDFAARDAANGQLGGLGEEFAFWYEKERLRRAGREDLADKVRWASRDIGDGLGFDILSFSEADESARYLEVKATGLGKYFSFLVTYLEVRCNEYVSGHFILYRVFDVGRRPRLYVLPGSLRESCELAPTLFQAHIRAG